MRASNRVRAGVYMRRFCVYSQFLCRQICFVFIRFEKLERRMRSQLFLCPRAVQSRMHTAAHGIHIFNHFPGFCCVRNGVFCSLPSPNLHIAYIGVYGDVQRVKILYNKKDSALIQMAESHQAYLGKFICKSHTTYKQHTQHSICSPRSRTWVLR